MGHGLLSGTFQAHVAPVSSVAQVEAVMDALLSNRKLAAATHHIMAYRIAQPNGSVSAPWGKEGWGGGEAVLSIVLFCR